MDEAACRLRQPAVGRAFARAIDYAENGYPIAQRVASDLLDDISLQLLDPDASAVFLKDAKPYTTGERHAQPLLGQRLREIAAHGASAFYEDAVARWLLRYLNSLDGLHMLDDFAAMKDGAFYTTPVSNDFRG